jgi:hypothetical protein
VRRDRSVGGRLITRSIPAERRRPPTRGGDFDYQVVDQHDYDGDHLDHDDDDRSDEQHRHHDDRADNHQHQAK